MDLQVSRGNKAAALQVIRYVQLIKLSQITPTITVKMININATKKYNSRRRALKIYALSPQSAKALCSPRRPPNTAAFSHLYSSQQESALPPRRSQLFPTQQCSHDPLLTLSATKTPLTRSAANSHFLTYPEMPHPLPQSTPS
jgi:hypothetical protein